MQKFFWPLVITLLAAAGAAKADAQPVLIGARAGGNLASESWSMIMDGQTFSIRTGILAGGQVDYWFDKSWALSAQLLYDQKGVHSEVESGANVENWPQYTNGTADWVASYIELPLLAKVTIGSGYVRPYFFVGPSIGFLLSNVEKVSGDTYFPFGIGPSYQTTSEANIRDSTNKIDLAIVGGVGISHVLTSGILLFVDASYAYGLLNTDNYFNDRLRGLHIYSRDIRLAAGILLPVH